MINHQLPSVSICTITSNRPRLLALLAECVISQAYPPELLEWVVLDDSSQPEPVDLSAAEQTGISVLWQQLPNRLPIGAKRNHCHQLASGEVLLLMDDDDYYPPTRVPDAVAALAEGPCEVAGCSRMPLLLLPEGSRWLTPAFGGNHATANTLAYRRSYLEAGHQFDPAAEQAEEPSFLEGFTTPLHQLEPRRTLTNIGHGGNTVDKRLWIARMGQLRFEPQSPAAPGFPPDSYIAAYCRAMGFPAAAQDASPAETASAGLASPEPREWRVAVITPYYNESLEVLERCHRSVLAQTHRCTHVLVADGPGYAELASWDCRHIVLGVGHGDNGNTPRSIGALAAMNEGFSAIAYLDADNWWADNHLEAAVAAQVRGNYGVVFASRYLVFPDGRRLTELPEEDRSRRHADTSAMVIFEPAFSTLALWAQMPKQLAPLCDRVLFAQLMASQHCGWVEQQEPTLYFETWYAGHFLKAGLLPPANAKFLAQQPASTWEATTQQFRQRCTMPVHLDLGLSGAAKVRLDLVSILGPARSGGTLLQSGLCRHFSYFGLPEHQFLAHLVEALGPDHRLRHDGEALQQALAAHQCRLPLAKAHDRRPLGLEQAIGLGRSFTLLEAYFRVIQALIPEAARTFSRGWGHATVLDRSCTHALVADVLFRCLPEHRAVLMLRDPLEQIAAVRRQQQQHPQAWRYSEGDKPDSIHTLAEVYLRSLAVPLAAAPHGQLKLVPFEQLLAEPEAALEAVSVFLGLEPNPLLALEALPSQPGLGCNQVHQGQWQALVEALPQQLLREEPWKEGCLAGMPGTEFARSPANLGSFGPTEREALETLFTPVRQAMAWLAERALQPAMEATPAPPHLEPPVPGPNPELATLSLSVAEGLLRHSQALNAE